jgi:hypothetical protein
LTLFVVLWIVPFVIAAAIILRVPAYSVTQLTIELATISEGGLTKPLNVPAQVAKDATDVYLPLILYKSHTLDDHALRATVAGNTVSLLGESKVSDEGGVKEIEQRVSDMVLAQEKKATDIIRKELDITLSSTQRKISSLGDQIELLNKRKVDLEKHADLHRHITSGINKKLDDASASPPETEYARARLWSAESATRENNEARTRIDNDIANATLQREDQIKAAELASLKIGSLTEARITIPPTSTPVRKNRIPLFLMAAMIGTFIFSVLVVLLLDRFKYGET